MEIVPSGMSPAFIALDNIRLRDCFTEFHGDACTPHQFRCKATNECINSTKICDITLDCEYGEDEYQNCGKSNCYSYWNLFVINDASKIFVHELLPSDWKGTTFFSK